MNARRRSIAPSLSIAHSFEGRRSFLDDCEANVEHKSSENKAALSVDSSWCSNVPGHVVIRQSNSR